VDERARRLLGLLGLARRAGRLALGARAVQRLVARDERPLVVLASDAGGSLRADVGRWRRLRGVVDDAVTTAELSQALGREKLAVVAVADPGFVRGIEKLGTGGPPDPATGPE
jgi:ribosomal protein L7Ae-like RNA K-turn-binding protein